VTVSASNVCRIVLVMIDATSNQLASHPHRILGVIRFRELSEVKFQKFCLVDGLNG